MALQFKTENFDDRSTNNKSSGVNNYFTSVINK